MKFYFIRHAHSTGNQNKIFQGQLDTELSAYGRQQASFLRDKIPDYKDIDAIFSSPLQRARDTAIISLQLDEEQQNQMELIEDLKEIDRGDLTGKKKRNLDDEDMMLLQQFEKNEKFKEHNGESQNEFKQRVIAVMEEIIDLADQKNYQTVLVFGHGGVFNYFFRDYTKLTSFTFANTSVLKVEVDPDSRTYNVDSVEFK